MRKLFCRPVCFVVGLLLGVAAYPAWIAIAWMLPAKPFPEALVPPTSQVEELPWESCKFVAAIDAQHVDGGQIYSAWEALAGTQAERLILLTNRPNPKQHWFCVVHPNRTDIIVINNIEVWWEVPPPEQLAAR